MKKTIPTSSAAFLALLICGCILLLITQKAQASLMFGKQESIYRIQDTNIKNDKGETLNLAHKVSALYVLAGVYVHDDGYVLQLKDKGSSYYDLSAEEIAKYQAEGLLPTPLPSYSVPFWDYLLGYSLWIVLGISLLLKVWSSIQKSKNPPVLSPASPPSSQPLPPNSGSSGSPSGPPPLPPV